MIDLPQSHKGFKADLSENDLAKIAVDIAYTIHSILGPGLLESVYESAFVFELEEKGIHYTRQQDVTVKYKTALLDKSFRTDIIMCNKLLVELKSVECLEKIHHKITLNYMKLTGLKLGLLINFNVNLIKDGIHRKINDGVV
ncbi:MAG: GxxExxY protein [Chitinophagaceae bacterium]|nr:GxxExxY protein [Chitinophagaceae bacterium]